MTDTQTSNIRRLEASQAVLLEEPRHGVPQTSEMLFGETFTILDREGAPEGEWLKVENRTDGHVGWLPPGTATGQPTAPTHRVRGLKANLHPAPTHKAVPIATLSFASLVVVEGEENGWVRLDNGLWVFGKHLEPVATPRAALPVETAARFLETPYVWGGRSCFGIDCSGLVQVALGAAGIVTHHSSRMQRDDERLGPLVSEDGQGPNGQGMDYRRGDVVFFPGHVGIMLDGATLLHATVFTMSVVTEPLADVAARAERITGVRRPDL
ncbi:C40 family peptidase [Azospirillum sp. sgz302134]